MERHHVVVGQVEDREGIGGEQGLRLLDGHVRGEDDAACPGITTDRGEEQFAVARRP